VPKDSSQIRQMRALVVVRRPDEAVQADQLGKSSSCGENAKKNTDCLMT
jgi:hypothetical protein